MFRLLLATIFGLICTASIWIVIWILYEMLHLMGGYALALVTLLFMIAVFYAMEDA